MPRPIEIIKQDIETAREQQRQIYAMRVFQPPYASVDEMLRHMEELHHELGCAEVLESGLSVGTPVVSAITVNRTLLGYYQSMDSDNIVTYVDNDGWVFTSRREFCLFLVKGRLLDLYASERA